MRIRRLVTGFALLALVVGCAGRAAPGVGDGWVLLGQRQVSDRVDHDRIVVSAARTDFTRIKLTVRRASVDFHRVVVHFANGGDQEIQLRSTIRAGGETRAIDLRGGDRVIRSVEFWYDANTIRGRTATVQAYAHR